jgi:hypothetical protein
MDPATLATIVGYVLLAISEILSLIPNMPQNGIVHSLIVSMADAGRTITKPGADSAVLQNSNIV